MPIFVGIIGGIIAYFSLRYDDPRLAKFCIQLGILLTVIQLVVYLPLVLLAEQFAPGFGGINV